MITLRKQKVFKWLALKFSRVKWLQPYGSFSDDFYFKIGAIYDSRSQFGRMAGISNARMPDFLKVYSISLYK